MRSSAVLVAALAGSAFADSFSDWCNRNGLVANYNRILKDHPTISTFFDNYPSKITVFIPDNTAMKKWEATTVGEEISFDGVQKLFKYMAIDGEYTIADLEQNTGKTATLYDSKDIDIHTKGVAGNDITVYISSGTGLTHNSTVGVDNTNFHFSNGMIQLVSRVFELPDSVDITSGDQVTSSATKNTIGAISVLSLLGAGLMAVL